ncbi:MAG: protein kinase [Phycisphaerales bacterium]|nr:MAG: protein kinase [Phycisphaerales bacterium]
MAQNESPDQETPLERERRIVEAARRQVELHASEEEGPTTPPPDSADDAPDPSSVGEDIGFAHVGASLLEALIAPPADDADEKLAAEISRYEVLGPLGKGGMGEVYKARDRRLGRTVAIKRIGQRIAGSKGALPRLLAEARAVAALNHHNIVQVYDIDQDDDGHFITMEYVEGEDLRAKIQRDGKIDPERAVEITRQLAGALGYAHAQNIIHRDIKPSNILINTQGTPKIADFGLARMAGPVAPGLTHTGAMMGTVEYASPEQLEDAKNVDHRTDIYSLGATLYEMVTGVSPRRIEESKIVEELRPYVMRSLERDPDQRFQTIKEFEEALGQVIIGDVEALLHKAEFCHRSGDLEGAAQRYERVLRIDPKHTKAQEQAALIASKIEETRQARREATEAARRGDWKAAATAWQHVLDSAPGDLEAIQQHAKAQAQIRNEQLIAAIEQARSHLDGGDPVAARAQCRVAHEIDPENQEVAAILNGVRAAERRLRDHKMRAGAEAFKMKEYSSAVVLLTEALQLMRKNHPNRSKLINSINLAQASQWIADADEAIDKEDLVQAAELLDEASKKAGKMKMVVKRIETRRERIKERQARAAKQATRWRRLRIGMIAGTSGVGVALIAVIGAWLLQSQEPEAPSTLVTGVASDATAAPGGDGLVEMLSDFESEDRLVPRLFINAKWRAQASDPTAMSTCEVDLSDGAEGTGSCLRWEYQAEGAWAKVGLFLTGSWEKSVDLSAYSGISFHIKSTADRLCQFTLQSDYQRRAGIAEAKVPFDVTPQWHKQMIHFDAPPFEEETDFTHVYAISFVDHDEGFFSNEMWLDQVMLHRRRATDLESDSAIPNERAIPLVITADQIPIEVGAKWTSAITSPDANLNGGRHFYSIVDKFDHNGETYFRRRAEIPGVIERTDGLQVLKHDGWFGFWEPGDDVPYDVTVKLPLSAGMEWEQDVLYKHPDGTKELVWNKWRAEAEETIDVPAGTFRCIRVRSFEYTPEEGNDRLVWLAPDVGMVKVVFLGGGHTFELLSFECSASGQNGHRPVNEKEVDTNEAIETIDKGEQLSSGVLERLDVETELLNNFDSLHPLVPDPFPNARWRAIAQDETAISTREIEESGGANGTRASLKWSYEIKGKWAALELLFAGSWGYSVDLSAYEAISFYVKGARSRTCKFSVLSRYLAGAGGGAVDVQIYPSAEWQHVVVHLNAPPFKGKTDLARVHGITFGVYHDGRASNEIWIDQIMLHRLGTPDARRAHRVVRGAPIAVEDKHIEILSDFESENPLVPNRFTNARWSAGTDGPATGSTCTVDSGDGAAGSGSSLKWAYEINGAWANVGLLLSGSWDVPVNLSAYDAISFYIKGATQEGCAFKMQSAARPGAGPASAALELDIQAEWRRIVIHLDAPPFQNQIDLTRVHTIALVDWEPDHTSNEVWIDQIMLHRARPNGR